LGLFLLLLQAINAKKREVKRNLYIVGL